MFDWYWVATLLAVAIAVRLIRPVLSYVIAPGVSAGALAAQPETIHLEPGENAAWAERDARDRLTGELRSLGFAEAGTHVVRELPQVRLRLLANATESLLAAIYEHPKRGMWVELACRFTDGTSMTWSTLPPSGLDPRPGHPVHNLSRVSVGALWKAVLRERPAHSLQPVSVTSVGPDFERAWAESIAWRKQQGISRLEVARVSTSGGKRKAA